jgi:fucose permease
MVAFFIVTKSTMHRPLAWFAWFLVVVGFALMAILTRDSGTAKWLCIALVSGFGAGILYPTLSTFAYSTPRIEYKDDAVTNLAFFQSLGQTLGVALGSSILQNQLLKELRKHPILHNFALRYVKNVFILVNIVRDMSGNEDVLKLQVVDIYVASIRVVWVVMAVLAAVAMVASLLISGREVMQLTTSQVGRPEAMQNKKDAKNDNGGCNV